MSNDPHFKSNEFLRRHIASIMHFYHPRSIDKRGGFFHYFLDDGTIYNANHRHLVSSTRFIVNYAAAFCEFGNTEYLQATQHGLKFLREVHRNSRTGGYAWTLINSQVEDETQHCYGLAFVMLAYSYAIKAGIDQAQQWLNETWELLEVYFWDAEFNLYRDEADAQWNFSPYRGQNANMHMCEAMLSAFEATRKNIYLDRAMVIAKNITKRQASLSDDLIWEHYDQNWDIDWSYNLENPKHLFRPWGFQVGHQTEWAKLLLMLERHVQAHWLLPTAQRLFDRALRSGWDSQHGGLFYGFDPQRVVCDSDKYFWVQAESLAAAALLALRTGQKNYWDCYEKLWHYSWMHFVDHQHGAWFRILDANNKKYSSEKSPAGKVDYHTMGACYEIMRALNDTGIYKLSAALTPL